MADVNRVGRTCAMLTANWLGLPSAATTELVTATGILGIAVKAGSNEAAALVGSHLIEDRDGLHFISMQSLRMVTPICSRRHSATSLAPKG
jgi:hypothetical protein